MSGKVNADARRRVRRTVAALGLFALAGGPLRPAAAQTPAPPEAQSAAATLKTPQAPVRSVVYTAHDPAAIDHYQANSARVRAMVDRVVVAATGKDSVAAAWRSLVEPRDIVGIKISAAGGALGATHRAVVEAIVDGLKSAGVPTANILVWDRDAEDLQAAGYLARDERTSTLDCPVAGIEPRAGYDPKDTYNAPYLGRLIWGDLLFKGNPVPADAGLHSDLSLLTRNPLEGPSRSTPAATTTAANDNPGGAAPKLKPMREENLSTVSHYCTILSRRVTKIVNVPVFADNVYTGLGGALFNATIPNVDNWRRLVGAPHYGQTAIPELYSDPHLGGRIVLNIADGLVAQIAGAPVFNPLYARHHATIYASRDAVALDATLLRELEAWRAQAQLPALGEIAGHVHTAADIGLGNFAPDRIEVRAVNP